MADVLRALDPRSTLVHVHGFTQALSTSPLRCALDKGFKVVCTMHDFFAACPTGAFFDFQASTPCYRRALSYDCVTTNCDKRHYSHKVYRVARSVIQIRFGGLPRRVKDYISLSRRSEEVLLPYLPPDARIHSLPNPIGIERTPPVDVARNDKMIVVGRLEPEKGIHMLLDAARAARVRLTLVGDGSLRGLAEESGLCRVTGWLSRPAVLAELESARCLVFPSLCYETYGLGVAEAAARGIPAIVSDLTAAAERVENNVTGWHARAGDTEDLARCLNIVKEDAIIRSAGNATYARWWVDPPTREKHIAKLLDIYARILSSADGAS
jgi:glycosyltransferase involved in cell wall biosynthesis